MFGKNEIVGQKYFKDAKDDQLFVTSIFVTLQGEGPFRGVPAVFVRLAKCNLACTFCDTYFDGGDWLSFTDIAFRIDRAVDAHFGNDVPEYAQLEIHPDGHVKKRQMVLVMTGGEPLLQKNIGPFLTKMEEYFEWTQIESNGIVYQELPENTVLVISPKCVEKGGKPIKYTEPHPKNMERLNALKFVVTADQDSLYSDIPQYAKDLANDVEVYISPMNIYNSEPQKSKQLRGNKNDITLEERSYVDEVISFWEPGLLNMEENQKNHEYAAKLCMKYGAILNLQIHLYASLA